MSDTAHILLVEDSDADAQLVQECFDTHESGVTLHHVHDALAALRFLRRKEEFAHVPTPHLVLLDLNLPKMSGHLLLKQMRSDPDVRGLPVVVMSSSTSPSEIRDCYEQGANAYLAKPVGFHEFQDAMRAFELFWLQAVCLPNAVPEASTAGLVRTVGTDDVRPVAEQNASQAS